MTSPSIDRVHLLDQLLADPLLVARVKGDRVVLGPGDKIGRHLHPCPVVGEVVAGALRLQISGQPEQLIRAGEAFHEPAGMEIPVADNASDRTPVTFIAYYLLAPGQDNTIEMLDQAGHEHTA